uniref:Uncharacterized protein n=1 Tax=Glossina palpalis gambiensis TaxID=67801 RepID=A0A1B0C2M5_9MUSC
SVPQYTWVINSVDVEFLASSLINRPLESLDSGGVGSQIMFGGEVCGKNFIKRQNIRTDVTRDGMVNIVVSAFNSRVMAFDGRNFTMLWNYNFPASDSVSAIVSGHFNYDNIRDFMVKYNTGLGFPPRLGFGTSSSFSSFEGISSSDISMSFGVLEILK